MSSIIVILEVLLFCLGGTIFAYRPSGRVSEALSLGIVIALILFSLIFQISFLLQLPSFSFLLEIAVVIYIFILLRKRRQALKDIVNRIQSFVLENKIISTVIIICWIYLFLQAVLLPPGNWDSMTYNLSRVFLFQQENSLFLKSVSTIRQAVFVVGGDILAHAFLRFYSDYGIGIFSFLSYVSVGLGTYALARNFSSVKISIASTFIIISLPEFCFQSTSTKNDLFTAAAAVFCLITASNFLERFNAKDFGLTILGLSFGFAAKTTFAAFLMPFTISFGFLFIKKYGLSQIIKMIRKEYLYFILLTLPILINSQILLFAHNAYYYHDLTGNITYNAVQKDGIKGGLANLVRYFFQSIDLFPLSYLLTKLKIDIANDYIFKVYNFLFGSFFSNSGFGFGRFIENYGFFGVTSFSMSSVAHEDFSWYGPAGLFVIIPAILFSLYKGNPFLRATSFSLLGLVLITSYQVTWLPFNNRYLTLFFDASGACVSFLLKTICLKLMNARDSSKFIKTLIIASSVILISACTLNSSKPLFGLTIKHPLNSSIWLNTNFGTDRLYYARKYYGDDRVERFKELVPAGAKVALMTGDDTWTYPYYLINSKSNIIKPEDFHEFKRDIALYDYLLFIELNDDKDYKLSEISLPYQILWHNSSNKSLKGQLVKIIHKKDN